MFQRFIKNMKFLTSNKSITSSKSARTTTIPEHGYLDILDLLI